MNKQKGKLIVIEGSDGSGKSTQLALLKNYLKKKHYPVQTYKFPDYEAFFGRMIGAYLRGEYGDLQTVNPYLISVIYAQDRAQSKKKLDEWINNGNILLLDRYVPSNLAHQCGRLPRSEREKFLKWESELEYTINKIPREDIVIYLHIPYKVSMRLLDNHNRPGHTYAKGQKKDIVEKNEEYLQRSEETYNWLAEKFSHWVTVECIDEKGSLKSKEDIHEEVKQIVRKKGMFSPY